MPKVIVSKPYHIICELREGLNYGKNNSAVEACLALCAECFIGCIEGMVEYFNRYAYIEIGMSFN